MPARPALLAAAVAAVLAGPARADVHSTARVSGFGYTLIDLAPDDGIAPSIEFLVPGGVGGGTWVAARYGYHDGRVMAPDTVLQAEEAYHNHFRDFAPVARSVGVARVGAAVSIAGRVADHSLAFSAQGYLLNDGSDAARWRGTGFDADTEPATFGATAAMNPFRLTPHTQVVWSGRASLQARTTVGLSDATAEKAYARLYLTLWDAQNRPVTGFDRNLEIERADAPTRRGLSTAFSVSLSNAGAERATSYLVLGVLAAGRLDTPEATGIRSPVPEPGTAVLALCGLGALGGWTAWRRRRGGAG